MLEEILRSGIDNMGISVSVDAARRFRVYYDYLTQKNAVMNLTAIKGEEESARLHFLDSLSPMLLFDFAGKSVVDVGTGAGFPGLPLKIACPELSLTLIDSLSKRISFLKETTDLLGLEVQCIHARAEECGDMRQSFDFAVSRAVARLNVLCELCLPYVKPGGYFLALKGPMASEELLEAQNAIKMLGGREEKLFEYSIPGTQLSHKIVVIKKVSGTPSEFPRRYAQIKSLPL